MTPDQIGRATLHVSPYKFTSAVRRRDAPPFPSVPTYDAKVWSVLKDYHKRNTPGGLVLFWNVGA